MRMVSKNTCDKLEQYFETEILVKIPEYLEIVDIHGELLGILELGLSTWDLRVDGNYIESFELNEGL
jgi:hypothetical protein